MTRFLIAGEISLPEELWNYVVDKYFSLELPVFENFSIQSNELFSLRWTVIGLTIGIIIASIVTVYNKKYIGDFVRHLVSQECLDAKSAKTLAELGYHKNRAIRNVIKTNGTISRWVRCVEEDEFLLEVEKMREAHEEEHKDKKRPPKFKAPIFKRDPKTMHFYIPEEICDTAEVKFDKTGAEWRNVIIVSIISLILCALVSYFLSDILIFVDNFISLMKGL